MNARQHRIGLNAHLLNLAGNYRSAGINWYIYHLLQHLTPSSELAYTIFSSEPRAHEHFQQLTLAPSRLPTDRPIVRIFWEQFIQPFALRQHRIDLLHGLAFAGPLATSIPWLATIYDLSFIHFPASFNRANRIYLTWAVRHAVQQAKRLVAISESTKRDLVKLFGAPPEKIAVVYCGVDSAFTPARNQAAIDALKQKYRVDKFVLHVGTIEPRKNLPCLVRAFAKMKRQTKLPHQLVLIGARGWKYAEVDAAIEATGIAREIIFPGYVPQAELPTWYHAADLFVYPSLYEGFGLPPLDALASGTPTITSNAASLPEVVGDAALQIDPLNEEALCTAMIHLLTDQALRAQMIERGLAQAQKFSWAHTAQETIAVYRAVLSEINARMENVSS